MYQKRSIMVAKLQGNIPVVSTFHKPFTMGCKMAGVDSNGSHLLIQKKIPDKIPVIFFPYKSFTF